MFGIEEDYGDSIRATTLAYQSGNANVARPQYGRNQQYGRSMNPPTTFLQSSTLSNKQSQQDFPFTGSSSSSTTTAAASKGGFKFQNNNSDSDEDDNRKNGLSILGNKKQTLPTFSSQNPRGASNLNALSQSSTFTNSTNRLERPNTAQSSIQSAMDRQREQLLNKQRTGFTGSSMSFNSKPGSGFSYGQSSDIDFNLLKTIVNENKSAMYEPGSLASSGIPTGLAPLSKTNNLLKFNEFEKSLQTDQKFMQLNDDADGDDDDDASDDGKGILEKKQQQQQKKSKNSSGRSSKRSHDNSGDNLGSEQSKVNKEKSAALLKNLYGDTSEESEEEEGDDAEKLAHERKLEEITTKKTTKLIGDDDDNDDDDDQEDGEAQVVGDQKESDIVKQKEELASENAGEKAKGEESSKNDVPAGAGETKKQEIGLQIATNIEINNMKDFLTKPLPKGMIIQMTIRRDKSGFARFYPKYHLHLSNGLRYLMTGKKRSSNKTSNYLMSMSKTELTKKSTMFLGKVRSNFLGTEFHVFDTGINPKQYKHGQTRVESVRKELATVTYESNLLSVKGPRKMQIVIPSINKINESSEEEEPNVVRPMSNKDGIFARIKAGNTDGLTCFKNKSPKWNQNIQAFVLNFKGRVDQPSVKNFQIVHEANDDMVLLQFGRTGSESFNMDVAYPFSITQAFGICLSSFDNKIACE